MTYVDTRLHQIAALPVFVDRGGGVDVCLVTSRGGGRWIIPKGNPIRGLAPHEVAAREALEEAGLIGQPERHCIGTFDFSRRRGGSETICSVDVYVLKVQRQLQEWAEMDERMVLRCSIETAMSLVAIQDLAALISRHFSTEADVSRFPDEAYQPGLGAS